VIISVKEVSVFKRQKILKSGNVLTCIVEKKLERERERERERKRENKNFRYGSIQRMD
jgi:hypothetical protein